MLPYRRRLLTRARRSVTRRYGKYNRSYGLSSRYGTSRSGRYSRALKPGMRSYDRKINSQYPRRAQQPLGLVHARSNGLTNRIVKNRMPYDVPADATSIVLRNQTVPNVVGPPYSVNFSIVLGNVISTQSNDPFIPNGYIDGFALYHKYYISGSVMDLTFCNASPYPLYLWCYPCKPNENDSPLTIRDIMTNPLAKWALVPPAGATGSTCRLTHYMTTNKLYGHTVTQDIDAVAVEMSDVDVTDPPTREPSAAWEWRTGLYTVVPSAQQTVILPSTYVQNVTWYAKFFDRRNQRVLQ